MKNAYVYVFVLLTVPLIATGVGAEDLQWRVQEPLLTDAEDLDVDDFPTTQPIQLAQQRGVVGYGPGGMQWRPLGEAGQILPPPTPQPLEPDPGLFVDRPVPQRDVVERPWTRIEPDVVEEPFESPFHPRWEIDRVIPPPSPVEPPAAVDPPLFPEQMDHRVPGFDPLGRWGPAPRTIHRRHLPEREPQMHGVQPGVDPEAAAPTLIERRMQFLQPQVPEVQVPVEPVPVEPVPVQPPVDAPPQVPSPGVPPVQQPEIMTPPMVDQPQPGPPRMEPPHLSPGFPHLQVPPMTDQPQVQPPTVEPPQVGPGVPQPQN